MARYLVSGIVTGSLSELRGRIDNDEISNVGSFRDELEFALRHMRLSPDGHVMWEQRCDCDPPLAVERREVLDHYFCDIRTRPVEYRVQDSDSTTEHGAIDVGPVCNRITHSRPPTQGRDPVTNLTY